MEHVFPVVCFCIARQMLTTGMSTRKRAWQRMPLVRSPWAKSLSLGAIPAAGWQRAMVAVLARLRKSSLALHLLLFYRGSVWDPARVPSPDSRFARESPIRKIAHVV